MSLKNNLLIALLAMSSLAHANTTTLPLPKPVTIPKVPKGGWVGVAVQVALEGVGWVMDEGTKVNRTTTPDETTSPTGTATNTGGAIPSHGQYPYEYLYSDKAFSSPQQAHQYIVSPSHLSEKKLKRTRRSDGLEYDRLDIYYGYSYYHNGSSVGYFISNVQVGSINENYIHNIGGSLYSFVGQIVYQGRESEENVKVSNQYKDAREKARQELTDAINNALPDDYDLPEQDLPDEIPDSTPRPIPDTVPVPVTVPDTAPNDPTTPEKNKPQEKPKPVPVPVIPVPVPDATPSPSPDATPSPSPDATPSPSPDATPKPDVTPSTDKDKQSEPMPFELPAFCDWAKWFCDGEAEKQDDTEIEIDEPDLPTDSVKINFGGSCPAPKEFPFSLVGRSMNFTLSFDGVCKIATAMGTVVKVVATVIAGYILAGIKS